MASEPHRDQFLAWVEQSGWPGVIVEERSPFVTDTYRRGRHGDYRLGRVVEHRLENGLRVYLNEIGDAKQCLVNAGTIFERAGIPMTALTVEYEPKDPKWLTHAQRHQQAEVTLSVGTPPQIPSE